MTDPAKTGDGKRSGAGDDPASADPRPDRAEDGHGITEPGRSDDGGNRKF